MRPEGFFLWPGANAMPESIKSFDCLLWNYIFHVCFMINSNFEYSFLDQYTEHTHIPLEGVMHLGRA